MNILFEEDGIKTAKILTDNNASLQVELPHGKRSKIKLSQVLLKFETPEPGQLLEQAQNLAKDIDIDFLWECAGPDEFSFTELAQEYAGKPADPVTACAILISLYNAPIHFYKKGHGRFKPATPAALQSALAAQERRRLIAETIKSYTETLTAGELPSEFLLQLNKLMFSPDKTSPEFKAIEQASQNLGITTVDLFKHCGAIPSEYAWHLNRFLWEFFPNGPNHKPQDVKIEIDLPTAPVSAFSIDDAATTEIDDAFSVTSIESGWQIGIHIAAPALMPINCSWEITARQRLSTVYIPGEKITMLPPEAVACFSLDENTARPALSLYFNFTTEGEITESKTVLNLVPIVANLDIEALDPLFELDNEALISHPFGSALKILNQLTIKLKEKRNAAGHQSHFIDYNFQIENNQIKITRRERGTPIDRIVSELMILANSTWAENLATTGVAGIFRGQKNGKVRMSTHPAPHQGLGVGHYIWATSPLRRYADFFNQRQLMGLFGYLPKKLEKDSEELFSILHDFEQTYDAYAQFQKHMERFWCLRYLLQENLDQVTGTVIKEGLVRLDSLPLILKIPGVTDAMTGQTISLKLGNIDLLELTLQANLA